jgi:branched-chain amino acid transport system substrate-binding protein
VSARSTLAGVLLLALAACGTGPGEEIKLGLAGPIAQANGRSFKMASEMAIEEINQAGGIRGKRLVLEIKDDEARPERAIQVAAELRDDPRVVAVIGHIGSAASIAAADVYNHPARGLLQISPASSSPALSEAGEWTFRICPTDLQHGPALASWTREKLGLDHAAVLYANDEYGRGLLETFGAAFEGAGGQLVARDPFLPALMEDERALDPYIERAIREHMDALVIAGQAPEALKIVRAARRLGFTGAVLGADGITSLKDEGALAEGVYVTSAFLPDRGSPKAREFVNKYVERYNELPDHRGAMAYDAIHLVARALREVGPDRRALRTYIAGVGTMSDPYEGVSGSITFDENGDVKEKEVTVGVMRRGLIVTAM